MLKKTLVAAALTAISGAALANPPHWAPAHGYRAQHYERPYVRYYPVAPRPVYVREYYRPAPVPVVVYRAPHPDAGAAIVFGALLGAVVAHQIVTH
jgi:hypothetical protein